MNGANMTDLVLLLPELILVGAALALILAARRIQNRSEERRVGKECRL